MDIFSLQKRVDLYNPDQFLPYMLWNSNIEKFTYSYIGYNKTDYYIPLIRYAGKTQALRTSIKIFITGIPKNKYRKNGYLGMDRKWNTDFETTKAKQKSYKIKLDQKSVALFEVFIQECKKMNINLFLVYTPEYIEGQSFVSNRTEVVDIFKNLSKQYNLTFFDYSNDEICLDKNLFYNAIHLNKYGAEMFTKKLASDLKAQLKQN
jgi:hypothetical protein